MSMKLKKIVRESVGTDTSQSTDITSIKTAIGKASGQGAGGILKDVADLKSDIGASDSTNGSLKKRCKQIENAIGDESTEGTILYRIKALETAAQASNSTPSS